MARKTSPKPTRLEIKIEGEGIGLKDVSVRQLAELLESVASVVEAVAREQGLEAPKLSLERAAHGSASYQFLSEAPQANRVITNFRSTVSKRGRGASPETRKQLARLYKAGTKIGSVKIGTSTDKKATKELTLAPPVEVDQPNIEESTVVHGRVIGARVDANNKATITVRYDDGGSGEFTAADTETLQRAAQLITRLVEARVTFLRADERNWAGRIESVRERRTPGSFLNALDRARQALIDKGIKVDSRAIFAAEAAERDDKRRG